MKTIKDLKLNQKLCFMCGDTFEFIGGEIDKLNENFSEEKIEEEEFKIKFKCLYLKNKNELKRFKELIKNSPLNCDKVYYNQMSSIMEDYKQQYEEFTGDNIDE